MLQMRLFGGMEVVLDGVPLAPPPSRRAWSLLAWLGLNPGMTARARVAARFWPDVLDSSARASLRSAIWSLRGALGPTADDYLRVTRDLVGLADPSRVWVDVVEFDRLVADARLGEAGQLVRGDLLTGFDDEWVVEAREDRRSAAARVFEQLAIDAQENDHQIDVAIGWARRHLALDPLAEVAQQRLMRLLAAKGDRAAALAEYARFRDRLASELRVAPSAQTRRLAEDLALAPQRRAAAAQYVRALPLVGREQELRRLLAAWQRARDGSGSVVMISGEPGIGKTRLAAELVEHARSEGARTASTAALDLGGGAPLTMWAELIGDLTAELDAPPLDVAWPSALEVLVPDLGRRFGRGPAARLSAMPDLERARLFESTVALVEWASRRSLVLLLEDLHAADAASLELAGYLGRRVARMPALIVLTRRPLPRRTPVDALEHALRTHRALVCEVALDRLPNTQIALLARQVGTLTEPEVDQVVSASHGNALVAVEWARALAHGEREPPASLRGAVRAALAPLSRDARRLTDLAAVAGRDLTMGEVGALGVATPTEIAAEALDSGLLDSGNGRIGFRHSLLREAAYHDLPEPRRAEMHVALATVLAEAGGLDASRHAAEAARHYRLGGRGGLAVAQLVRAAAHARAVAALTEAEEFLAEALELEPARGDLLIELAEVQAWRGNAQVCEATFRRAIEALETGAPLDLARAWARRAAWNCGALCHPRLVRDSARTAIEILDAAALPSVELRVEALSAWAWGEAVAGEPATTDALLARVTDVLDGRPVGDLVLHWTAHVRALSLVRRGRFEDSYEPQIAAGEAAQRAGRPDLGHSCWLNAACTATCAGDLATALEFVDSGISALEGTGLATLEVKLLGARAHILTRMSRLEEARSASDAEQELADRLGNPALQALSEHDRGVVALARGDLAAGERLLASALTHDAGVSRPLARLARAEALCRLQRYDDAEQELRSVTLEPVGPGDMPDTLVPRLTRLQGLIAAGRGQPELAARRLHEAAAAWRRLIGNVTDGDRYTATLADLGRPPVAGLVEPARELDQVLADLAAVQTHAH